MAEETKKKKSKLPLIIGGAVVAVGGLVLLSKSGKASGVSECQEGDVKRFVCPDSEIQDYAICKNGQWDLKNISCNTVDIFPLFFRIQDLEQKVNDLVIPEPRIIRAILDEMEQLRNDLSQAQFSILFLQQDVGNLQAGDGVDLQPLIDRLNQLENSLNLAILIEQQDTDNLRFLINGLDNRITTLENSGFLDHGDLIQIQNDINNLRNQVGADHLGFNQQLNDLDQRLRDLQIGGIGGSYQTITIQDNNEYQSGEGNRPILLNNYGDINLPLGSLLLGYTIEMDAMITLAAGGGGVALIITNNDNGLQLGSTVALIPDGGIFQPHITNKLFGEFQILDADNLPTGNTFYNGTDFNIQLFKDAGLGNLHIRNVSIKLHYLSNQVAL